MMVFLNFGAGVADVDIDVDTFLTAVKHVYLYAMSLKADTLVAPAALQLAIDGLSMAVASENLVGYPIPIMSGDPNRHSLNLSSNPLLLGNPAKSAFKKFRARLLDLNGNAFVAHQGAGVWLYFETEKDTWNGEKVRASQWLRNETARSGGKFDERFDWVPSVSEVFSKQ